MSDVAISIIVPVYNTANYLKECLDSIQNQTLKEIEVIIIDDGSTDASPSICDYYKSDQRFKIIHNHNQGVSGSRNEGIEHSIGEYCMFVDSDDWLELTACEKMYKFAKKKEADLVIGGHVNISSVGKKDRFVFKDNCFFEGKQYEDEIIIHTLGLVGSKLKNPAKLDKLTPVWARLYKRDIIKKNNIRFIELNKLPSECLQFNFEFCLEAKNAAYLHDIVYNYRRNTSSSLTKLYRKDLWSKWKWWIDYEKDYLNKKDVSNDIWKAYHSRICSSIIPLGGNAIKLRTLSEQYKECNSFLKEEKLNISFNETDFSTCPFYWRVFFESAKEQRTISFIILTKIMRSILSLRKK